MQPERGHHRNPEKRGPHDNSRPGHRADKTLGRGRSQFHERVDGTVFGTEGDTGYTLAPDAHEQGGDLSGPEEDATKTRVNYRVDPQSELQAATFRGVRAAHDALVDGAEHPESVLSGYDSSFISPDALARKESKVCIGCMDERVPSPDGGMKVGVAGSGVLMTDMPRLDLRSVTAEQIYAYIESQESGDANFKKFVATMLRKKQEGWDIETSDHEGCGAVGIFGDALEETLKSAGNPIKLDRKEVAARAAKRLHAALGLEGRNRSAAFAEGSDIEMDGHPEIHDAFAMVIDLSGRNSGRIKVKVPTADGPEEHDLRALFVSGRYSPAWDYLAVEVEKGREIIRGKHGVGIDPPIVTIGAADDPAYSADAAIEKLGNALAGARVIKLQEPAKTRAV